MSPGIDSADETQVVEACDRLVDFAVWPRGKVEYRAWLDNFDVTERALAVQMLGRFTFISHQLVDHLFVTSFQAISNGLGAPGIAFSAKQDIWRQFCEQAIIVPVMGERPSPADSGWGFARKARQMLGIDEGRLKHPNEAAEIIAGGSDAPIVFVDDFVGSGEQFLSTWRRRFANAGQHSFASMSGRFPAYYCNVMMTAYGRSRIQTSAPQVTLVSGNMIPRNHNYSVIGSAMWPTGSALPGIRLARKIGSRLGYTKSDGGLRDWRGFHKLGLGIAMEDSVPDANLPLFFEDSNGWQPLVRRS
ncbi:hypothetical protein [uncultured Sphingosinicella sp.]|uniref:phosphoribosyltransferase-like protein n=1 Tax=uncultured Sphingosinicella sp. TaxID=478748 RepID=UPI0030DAD5F5|tara:strand:- start:79205 stop:80113 length:909 start_codon:yes stop_codon:yes gene_type:complete